MEKERKKKGFKAIALQIYLQENNKLDGASPKQWIGNDRGNYLTIDDWQPIVTINLSAIIKLYEIRDSQL